MHTQKRVFVVAALMAATIPAVADKNFAHSKSLGMSFIATGEPWCGPEVQMLVEAADAAKFGTPKYVEIVRKLGHVLTRECPQATSLTITGKADEQTVWTGSATKSDGWAAVEKREPAMAAQHATAIESGAAAEPSQIPSGTVANDNGAPVQSQAPAAAAVQRPSQAEVPVQEEEQVEAKAAERPAPAAVTRAEVSAQTPAMDAEAKEISVAALSAANFAVHGWTPRPVLPQQESTLDSVASKDQSCAIHYTVRPTDKGLVYLDSGVPCVDGWIHGSGKAVIKRLDGKQIAKMTGNFSRGFFTAQDDLDPDSIVGVNPEQPNNMLVLLKADSGLKAYYLGNVAVIGSNRWGFCHYAQVRVVTEDQNLFLDEAMIDLVVENAAALVARQCPRQRTFRFSAGSSAWDFDKRDHSVNYYVTQVHQDRRSKAWSFNKSRAWNGVIASRIAKAEQERRDQQRREREEQLAQQRAEREAEIARQAAERQARQEEYQRQLEQQRVEQAARRQAYEEQQARFNKWRQAKSDYDRLAAMGGVARLAYLASTSGPRFPLDLYAEQVVRQEPVSGAVLVRVSDDEGDHSEVDWPVSMRLDDRGGVIDDEGVYFVVGQVTGGERQDEDLPKVRMEVEKAWLCKERLCNDHGDVLGMVKARHEYPDFDPDQQPERPRW